MSTRINIHTSVTPAQLKERFDHKFLTSTDMFLDIGSHSVHVVVSEDQQHVMAVINHYDGAPAKFFELLSGDELSIDDSEE